MKARIWWALAAKMMACHAVQAWGEGLALGHGSETWLHEVLDGGQRRLNRGPTLRPEPLIEAGLRRPQCRTELGDSLSHGLHQAGNDLISGSALGHALLPHVPDAMDTEQVASLCSRARCLRQHRVPLLTRSLSLSDQVVVERVQRVDMDVHRRCVSCGLNNQGRIIHV